MRPSDHLHGVQAATGQLFRSLERLTDDLARAETALPGWTRGHVLTHLARNADAHLRVSDAALDGLFYSMYEGGDEARNRGIEEGAGRPASVLARDVRTTAARLEAHWNQIADKEWDLPSEKTDGNVPPRKISDRVALRWREVEVHHVDLALGYTPANWSQAYVNLDLPVIINAMPAKATKDTPRLMSWFLRDDSTGNAWIVSARGIRPGVGSATHTLHAPGHSLLAWLLGRQPPTAIGVERSPDESLALALPRFFPFG
jgi:maleylpyruvate isomerase